MPSKNMLPKGKRRQSVRAEYRAARDVANAAEEQRQRIADAELFGETLPPSALQPISDADRAPQPPVPRRTKTRDKKSGKKEAAKPSRKIQSSKTASETDVPTAVSVSLPPATEDQQDFTVDHTSGGVRLDQFLTTSIPHTSRSRVRLLIDNNQIEVNGGVEKSSYKVEVGDIVRVTGRPRPAPLHATAENIPLTVIYEDDDLAAIDKPAGMSVHAGSGPTDEARSGGTLVNALLHHFAEKLSSVGGELRPGIVHRLDKMTSGLILVAKNDRTHHALATMFHDHTLEKRYIALVHRIVRYDEGTIQLPIARDPVRRTRMTTRLSESWLTTSSHGRPSLRAPEEPDEEDFSQRRGRTARHAVTHYRVLERLHTSAGDFTLLDIEIETGRTHQIRVHMQSLGHPVVGDTLYGAPARIRGLEPQDPEAPTFARNFLHAAHLSLAHPINSKPLELEAPLPEELSSFLNRIRELQS